MKKVIAVIMFLLLFSPVFADDFDDIDFDFINNAFDGIKPVTNEQFNKTVDALTPKPVPNTFLGKLKTFLFGRQYGVDPAPKGQDTDIDLGGEKEAIQNIKSGIYYIKLLVSLVSSDGKVIPAGNYKIFEEDEGYLSFYQGSQKYGILKLKKFEDNLKNENDIVYSRVDIISDDVARVVYSTVQDTKCAYAKVYLQN